MELVIAVILGVILLMKVGADKAAVKHTRDAYDETQQKIAAWKRTVTDRNLEQQLRSYMQNPENKERVLQEITPSSPDFDLDLSGLPSGMYLVKVQFADGKMAFKKVVKQ